jgi:hypothetical protein
MALIDYPHVKRVREIVRIEPPGLNLKRVLVVSTDLSLRRDAPGYDAAALNSLADVVRDALNRLGLDKAEIESS